MKKRIEFIDIARGLAIIFIVLGHTLVHSENCSIIFKFLYSFHVVLFFVISGYIFRIKENDSYVAFIKNKFIRIMIPYFIWGVLFLIPYILFGQNVSDDLNTTGSFNIKIQLYNILYGVGHNGSLRQNSSLWFLPALFSMEILYYFFIKIVDKVQIKWIVLIPSIFISFITYKYMSFIMPWGINTALCLGIFFIIGYLLRVYNFFNSYLKVAIVIIPMFIIGFVSFFFNDVVSCIDYYYGNYVLMFLSSLFLSITAISVCYLMKYNKVLEYIGRNTMGILIFHKLVVLIFQTKLGIISNLLRNSNVFIEIFVSIVIVAISISFSLICTEIVRKTFPFLLGEVKNKTKVNI